MHGGGRLPVTEFDRGQHAVGDRLECAQVAALCEALAHPQAMAVGDVSVVHALPLCRINHFRHRHLPCPEVIDHAVDEARTRIAFAQHAVGPTRIQIAALQFDAHIFFERRVLRAARVGQVGHHHFGVFAIDAANRHRGAAEVLKEIVIVECRKQVARPAVQRDLAAGQGVLEYVTTQIGTIFL